MAKKAKTKRVRGCGCSAKSGKLFIVKTPERLVATKCQAKAAKIVKKCRKKHERSTCTWQKIRKPIRKPKARKASRRK